jgi:amino acid adenylation domain-containing protein
MLYNNESNPTIDPGIPNSILIETTEAQKEIWLSCKIGGDDANRAYNESISISLLGYLDQLSLKRALEALYKRHSLLTCTVSSDGESLILERGKMQLEVINLSNENAGFIEIQIADLIEAQADWIFDLENGPLTKLTLVQKGIEDHTLIFTAHHIICDGWSAGVFIRELSRLYNAYCQGLTPNLDNPPTYGDYSKEEKEFMDSPEFIDNLNFWKKEIGEYPETLRLYSDFKRPKERSFHAYRKDQVLNQETVSKLKQIAKNLGVSFVNLTLSSFEILMAKISSQDCFIIGLPLAGQVKPEYNGLFGHCVNLLPLPVTIDLDLNFTDYLKKRKIKLLEALENQQITFGTLLNELKVARRNNEIPIVPVVFNFDPELVSDVEFVGLDLAIKTNPRKFENFEIFLNIRFEKESIVSEWTYNSDLFNEETVSYWSEGFNDLLIQISRKPDLLIKSLQVNQKEDRQRFEHWNSSFLELTVENSFLELFEKNAIGTPNATAVLTNLESVNYKELQDASTKIAQQLNQLGVKKGDIVAVLMDRSAYLVTTLLGILKSGAAYLPLDPGFPEHRITYMIKDSSAKLILTEGKYIGKYATLTLERNVLDLLRSKSSKNDQLATPNSNDLAYILYTSGSTGKPKGVKVSHINLLNFLESMKIDLSVNPQDRLLAITTVSFDIAGLEIFLPLISGASVVLADKDTSRNGIDLLKMVKTFGVTMMQATPSTWRLLLGSGWDHPLDLKVLCGGEALTPDLAESMLGIFGSFWNVYGPTETTIWSTIKRIENHQEITIGRPIANTQVYILDTNLSPVPIGSIGEICIGGLGVSDGYLNQDELTNEKFVQNPFEENEATCTKIYRTGDLGRYLPNGEVICLGRLDNQVKVRGYRIELGEIESCLNKIEGIKEAAVTIREDVSGEKRLVGYIVPELPMATIPDPERIKQIRQHLKLELPDYMIPESWSFLQAFPLTANNKVDRKRLPEPNPIFDVSSEDFLPNTYFEQLIFDIWSTTLNQKNFNIKDDFFELGGNSLLAVKVMSQIDEIFGVMLPISTLFLHPTISSLAKKLEGEKTEKKWSSLVPIKTTGSKKPLIIVHGGGLNVNPFYLLAQHLDKEQPVYGIQARGLNGIDPPVSSIKEMAINYVNEILAVHPKGEIILGGYCSGGVVAFEMARCLEENHGISIEKVIMIEADAEKSYINSNGFSKMISKSVIAVKKLLFNLHILMFGSKICREEKLYYYNHVVSGLINKIAGRKINTSQDSMMRTIESLKIRHEKAIKQHRIEPMPINVALVKTKTQLWWKEDFENYGWKEYSNSVFTEEIPGIHDKIYESENIGALAAAVNKIIDQNKT